MDLLLNFLCRTQFRRLPVILLISAIYRKAPNLKGIPAEVIIVLVQNKTRFMTPPVFVSVETHVNETAPPKLPE